MLQENNIDTGNIPICSTNQCHHLSNPCLKNEDEKQGSFENVDTSQSVHNSLRMSLSIAVLQKKKMKTKYCCDTMEKWLWQKSMILCMIVDVKNI